MVICHACTALLGVHQFTKFEVRFEGYDWAPKFKQKVKEF